MIVEKGDGKMEWQFDDAELSELDSLINIEQHGMTAAQCIELMNALAHGRKIEAIKLVRTAYGFDLVTAKNFIEENYSFLVVKPSANSEGATLGDILNQAIGKRD